ncbi:hypothetical protein Tco_0650126 [Tanacetum coccineum]
MNRICVRQLQFFRLVRAVLVTFILFVLIVVVRFGGRKTYAVLCAFCSMILKVTNEVRIRQKSQENRQKTGKHGHENGRAQNAKPKPGKVKKSTMGQQNSHITKTKASQRIATLAIRVIPKKDPTALNHSLMIEGIQGIRLEEAWEELKGLEALPRGYK